MKYIIMFILLAFLSCYKGKIDKIEKETDSCRNFTNKVVKREFKRLGKLYKYLVTNKHTNYCFIEQEVHDMSFNDNNKSYYAVTEFYLKFYTRWSF